MRVSDESGTEICIDINFTRKQLDALVLSESMRIRSARDTLEKGQAQCTYDVGRRRAATVQAIEGNKVAFEIGDCSHPSRRESDDSRCEGAAVFAESTSAGVSKPWPGSGRVLRCWWLR